MMSDDNPANLEAENLFLKPHKQPEIGNSNANVLLVLKFLIVKLPLKLNIKLFCKK